MASSELPLCSSFTATSKVVFGFCLDLVHGRRSPPLFLLLQTGFDGLNSRFEEIFHFVSWSRAPSNAEPDSAGSAFESGSF
jgi:hypothetical protein